LDLTEFSIEDLFLAAIKAEVDSKTKYIKIADGVKNAFLKERLKFLAFEEEKHRELLVKAFNIKFSGTEPVLPDDSPVPLPEIDTSDENAPISLILESAMNAELAARDFYQIFALRFDPGSDMNRTLEHFALMEEAHHHLLKGERDNSLKFEDYDDYWPMMHVGP
jgi:rubrerythrin